MGLKTLATLLAVSMLTAVFWAAESRWRDYQFRRLVVVTVLVAVVGLPVVALYGQWLYMAARCGRQPVAYTNFAAAHSYTLPGDPGYSRSALFHSFVCSEPGAKGNRHYPR